MFRLIVPAVLALSLAGTAMAQSRPSDLAYCENLYATWDRYLSPRGDGRSGNVDAAAALDQCRRGNTAAGIPVLEKKLRDGLFTLPKR